MTNLKLTESNWYYDKEKEEYKTEVLFKGMSFPNQFWKEMKIIKSQKEFKCVVCQEKKPKATRCVGSQDERVCQNCFSEWIINSKQSFKEVVERFDEINKEFEENKKKWEKDILVCNL